MIKYEIIIEYAAQVIADKIRELRARKDKIISSSASDSDKQLMTESVDRAIQEQRGQLAELGTLFAIQTGREPVFDIDI